MSNKNKTSLLIISIDSIGEMMSGAGLRYLSLAKALSSSFRVVLAVPNEDPPEVHGLDILTFDPNNITKLNKTIRSFENVLISGIFAMRLKDLKKSKTKVIIDLYDPVILENLFYDQDQPLKRRVFNHFRSTQLTNYLAQIGDFFICGSERQRDFWLGVLASNGRINPANFEKSSDFRELIDVVGFGLPEQNLVTGKFLQTVFPQVGQGDKIVLWGGGVWDWLNPMPLIKIWKNIIKKEPKAKLVFLGIEHPNLLVPKHRIVTELIAEAKKIGEHEKSIFFIKWLSLPDREKLLSESHIGVTLHENHIETHFSIRTRIIDYIWAKIPILVSEGDITSEWVKEYKLGKVISYNDNDGLENALLSLLQKDKLDYKLNFDEIHSKLYWKTITKPLKDYCLQGQKAIDKNLNINFYPGNFSGNNLTYLLVAYKLGQLDVILNKVIKRFKK